MATELKEQRAHAKKSFADTPIQQILIDISVMLQHASEIQMARLQLGGVLDWSSKAIR